MAAFGLALGGGGVVGLSWELGVLDGLRRAIGVDPVDAATIVGTSSGSVIGARLRKGVPLDELVAAELGPPPDQPLIGDLDLGVLLEVLARWSSAEPMTPAIARGIAGLARQAQTEPEETWVARYADLGDEWPEGDLRVVTVDCGTGERAVWGRDDGPPLGRAVAASCAAPGIFPPVRCGAHLHVDGSVWSVSNGDVLADAGVDAAITVVPLVGDVGVRVAGKAALIRDEAALADAHVPSAVIVPGPDFSPLADSIMDVGARGEALAIGRADGEAAAPAVSRLLSA